MASSPVVPVELAPGITIGGGEAFPVIAGPCVVESEELVLATARTLAAMAERLGIRLIFKSSFDKANRSSIKSFRGPGLEAGLRALRRVREETGLPVLTDVHEPSQCGPAAEVCDVLQIPAFLCRQTDLVLAAAATGRAVNIKKGQFMAPDDMRRVVEKARSTGNVRVTVTERGCSFGYHDLVVDMRGFERMHEDGIAVIYDVTHSLQLPGAGAEESGGARRYAEPLARAAVAAGADGIFLEVHPDPDHALSDAAVQLDPARAEELLAELLVVRKALTPSPSPSPPTRTAGRGESGRAEDSDSLSSLPLSRGNGGAGRERGPGGEGS
ncbi:MAG: 2-dehydro-3-deoxyphosphooctonate aldolase synthase [Acidobacteriota bacterium]|jgi:2-dehydro-3-deoxyphosphooctonate aldolase (KDO 8-P synthase)|nr:2-dehydro-3-deoxyphosphooctonate aldolase synthase [Acidobacteriota bacterium]